MGIVRDVDILSHNGWVCLLLHRILSKTVCDIDDDITASVKCSAVAILISHPR